MTAPVLRLLASSRTLFAAALLAGALTGVGFLGFGGVDHTFTARFRDVDGLVAGNEVRIAGVAAGSVQSVVAGHDDGTGEQYAVVRASVDAAFWPLHQGTRISVQPKGVLSNVFVDVQPGPAGAPSLGASPYFGVDATQSPVNLDALANVFGPSVRTSIRTQLQEGVLALGGIGAGDLSATLQYADPLTRAAVPVTEVLATDSPQLDQLNFEFAQISGELAREDANVRALLPHLDTTLGALAAQEAHLQGTLVHAAGTFTSLDEAFASLQTQTDVEHLFKASGGALDCADSLAFYIEPLIAHVNPHVPNLDLLLNEFVTATGYGGDPSSVDTLRIDPTLPPSNETATESGGLSLEHHGNVSTHYQPPLLPLSGNPRLPTGCTEFFQP